MCGIGEKECAICAFSGGCLAAVREDFLNLQAKDN